jgi:hypothetical protein
MHINSLVDNSKLANLSLGYRTITELSMSCHTDHDSNVADQCCKQQKREQLLRCSQSHDLMLSTFVGSTAASVQSLHQATPQQQQQRQPSSHTAV